MQVAQQQRDITSNIWRSDPSKLKRYKIGYMRYFGSDCFDIDFYRENNWDQKHVDNATQLWEHWVISGELRGPESWKNCSFVQRSTQQLSLMSD